MFIIISEECSIVTLQTPEKRLHACPRTTWPLLWDASSHISVNYWEQ